MPTLMELRSRLPTPRDSHANLPCGDESLIADDRGRLTPAQMVEQKLRGLLAKPKSTASAGHAFRGTAPK
jgi:hypothetical protein